MNKKDNTFCYEIEQCLILLGYLKPNKLFLIHHHCWKLQIHSISNDLLK